jgi:hypothetical protein
MPIDEDSDHVPFDHSWHKSLFDCFTYRHFSGYDCKNLFRVRTDGFGNREPNGTHHLCDLCFVLVTNRHTVLECPLTLINRDLLY